MSRVLVVYYSRKGENYMPEGLQVLEKGHTAYAAEYIAEALNADLFEIDTVEAYAAGYRDCCMQAVAEAKANARPAIRGYVEDIIPLGKECLQRQLSMIPFECKPTPARHRVWLF